MQLFPMDELYVKLHERYTDLKKRKFSELDEMGKDQEGRFLDYVSANEDVIQHLEHDRERLRTENCCLRSEINSLISKREEEWAEFKKQLFDIKEEKNLLLEQIENLKSLATAHRNGTSWDSEGPGSSFQDNDDFSKNRKIPKRGRNFENPPFKSPIKLMRVTDMLGAQERDGAMPSSSSHIDEAVEGRIEESDSEKPDYFQLLLEILMGMKFSQVKQSDGSGISVMHQSSGYSFKLKWMKKGKGEETELLYRVSTLGTFEPIAPEWMRSTLKFGINMCPIFFQRISRVIC